MFGCIKLWPPHSCKMNLCSQDHETVGASSSLRIDFPFIISTTQRAQRTHEHGRYFAPPGFWAEACAGLVRSGPCKCHPGATCMAGCAVMGCWQALTEIALLPRANPGPASGTVITFISENFVVYTLIKRS